MKRKFCAVVMVFAIIIGTAFSVNTAAVTKIRGDINGDSKVDIKDMLLLRKYMADNTVSINETQADCDGMDGVTPKDVFALRKYLANLGTLFEDDLTGWINLYNWENDSVGQEASSVKIENHSSQDFIKRLDSYPIKNDINTTSTKALALNAYNSFSNPTIGSEPTTIPLSSDVLANATNLRMAMCIQDKIQTDAYVVYVGVQIKSFWYYRKVTLENYFKFGYFYFADKEYTKENIECKPLTWLPNEKLSSITLTKDKIPTIKNICIWYETSDAMTTPLIIDDVDYYVGNEGYDSTTEDANLPQPEELKNDGKDKYLCITFDDGPQTYVNYSNNSDSFNGKHYMDMYLDLAQKYDAHFSFFMVGKQLGTNDVETLKRALNLGCELQNHTWDHPYLTNLTADKQHEQLDKVDDWLYTNVGVKTTMLRPPMLAMNSNAYSELDVTCIGGYCPRDYDGTSVDYRMAYYNVNLKDGAVALVHENYIDNVKTVELLLEKYSKLGYKFVTLSELFKIKGVTPVHNKMYNVIE